MLNCIAVGLGGFAGAVCRYWMSGLDLGARSGFPLPTLLINLIGSFVIGFLAEGAQRNHWNPYMVLFFKVGVCGGFTTFSTFALESADLLAGHQGLLAAAYMGASLVLCVGGVFLGKLVSGLVFGSAA